jgi:hypothetical protein
MRLRFSLSAISLSCALAMGGVWADDDQNQSAHSSNSFNGQSEQNILAVELPADFLAILPDPAANDEKVSPKTQQDIYLEAYLQGSLDSKFPKSGVLVTVRNGDVLLMHLPNDKVEADKIVTYIKKFCGSTEACSPNNILTSEAAHEKEEKQEFQRSKRKGTWFPQSTVLFPTMVANPRQMCFSIGRRFRDEATGQNNSDVTFGDQFPLYRWSNVWKWKGDLQLELEAGVFAVFNHDHPSAPLINADYYVGIPLSYAVDRWAFRARLYHISSHLGDEFLLNHHKAHRRNKSFEAADFFTSYQLTNAIRVYGGVGSIVHSDSQMHLKPLYVEYGTEVRILRHNWTQLYGQPFMAIHLQNFQDNNWEPDAYYALGYEWGKIYGVGRKVRLFLEWHDGFSADGQFSRKRNDWFAIRLTYGF